MNEVDNLEIPNDKLPKASIEDANVMSLNFPKLEAAILFFVSNLPEKLNRIKLCKHLYYADGHYFQKFQETITENPYLHIEGSPVPLYFNEVIHQLVKSRKMEIMPQVITEEVGKKPVTVLKGLVYRATNGYSQEFTRLEKKVLNSVLAVLNGDLNLETRHFPYMYQEYAQTGLYEEIPFKEIASGKKPHLSWKAWANKVFRLMWQ